MKMKRGLAHIFYTWLVIGCAGYFLKTYFYKINQDLINELLIMLFLGILAECVAVTFPQGQLSAGFAVVLAAFVIYGGPTAVWISFLAILVGQGIANRGNPVRAILFNASMYVLAAVGSAEVYSFLGGRQGGLSYENAAPLLAFICTFFLINNLLLYIYQRPFRHNHLILNMADTLQWDGFTYLLAVPFGILIALLYKNIGIYGSSLFFLPVLVMQLILRIYVNLALANRELTALYEVARRLGGRESLEEMLGIILAQARRVIPFHTGVIYVWSGERKQFLPGAVISPQAELIRRQALDGGEGILGQLAETGRPKIIFEGRAGYRLKAEQGWVQNQRSLLVIPLLTEGEAVGIIALGDKRQNAFDEGNMQLMMIMSGQVKVAITQTSMHKRLKSMASRDPLTGLYNRRYFFLLAQAEFERALREKKEFVLMLVDVDNFNNINNRYGHAAGDAVLSQLGQLLSRYSEENAIIGRCEGEEFALVLTAAGEQLSRQVADRLRREVMGYSFAAGEDNFVRLTLSIGLAVFPRDGGDLGDLFKKAGQAVKKAKKNGKNRIVDFAKLEGYKDAT
ncbi:diguanylate cyclase with GAF sensor [Desulfofarcimen acetoxidans DSM 771]|uniref:Diguanylate cyclase with GAF sensor n=2 Tax=Desulfofarcimen acetoxidans TaxID=58138 RepID=C8VY43_DESAS|nr:diguanylate cyclase with GAF sensor [Desulfofarcimen acetoxidans DSM 771]